MMYVQRITGVSCEHHAWMITIITGASRDDLLNMVAKSLMYCSENYW